MSTRAVLAAGPDPPGETPAEIVAAPDHASRVQAARAAGAHAFIEELPESYHTPVSPGGIVLTESQWLRLTVSRLLAEDPPAVVL